MARTTQRMPRSQRRALVLATATDEFVAHGFRSTSMEEIAQAVGVTKPVLYQHFESKEELYLMVIEGVGARVLAAARALPALTGGRNERARRAIERVRRLSDDHLGVRLLLSEEVVSAPVTRLVTGFRTQLAREVARALVHHPALPDSTAVVLGRCLIALARDDVLLPSAALDGSAQPLASGRGPDAHEDDLEVVAQFIATGISGLEGEPTAAAGAHEFV
jgi:AcrR family transcriptional regulator